MNIGYTNKIWLIDNCCWTWHAYLQGTRRTKNCYCSLSTVSLCKSNRFIHYGLSLNLLSFKTCNPHPMALFTVLPLIFTWSTSFKNSTLHRASPLNMWQMKVKTGLRSNPSRLFVSFGHWETSDVVLPCWRRRGRDGDGDRGERDFPWCRPVMRTSNKVDVFMDNWSQQLRKEVASFRRPLWIF